MSQLYSDAGHARTIRTLQRYCASGHLDAQKVATTTGDKYLVTPQSVARHIEQIKELKALDTVATSRGASRPVATPVAQENIVEVDATRSDIGDTSRYVVQLETRLKEKDEVIVVLKEQLVVKDKQIGERHERERETNMLINGLQKLVLQLQSPWKRSEPAAGEPEAEATAV